MIKNFLFYTAALFLSSCGSQMGTRQAAQTQRALEETRIALLDLRQALREQQTDLQLLEERFSSLDDHADSKLAARVHCLEEMQSTIRSDIKALGTHANETTGALGSYNKTIQSLSQRLDEISKLKSTLNSISKSLGSGKIHKVSPGDTLDKIARKYDTSVQAIKAANGLRSHTILIGQELKIP